MKEADKKIKNWFNEVIIPPLIKVYYLIVRTPQSTKIYKIVKNKP